MNNNFKPHKSDIIVSVSPNPNQIYTNSKIRLYIHKNSNPNIQMNFVVEWKRVSQEEEQIVKSYQNSVYQCSPLDLGYFIQTKIKYEDLGILHEQMRRFGPIKLEPQLSNIIEKSFIMENLKIKIMIEGLSLDLTIKLNEDGITFVSRQNFQYHIRLKQLPEITLKPDLKTINLKLKNYTQTMNKFVSALIKRPLKSKIISLDIIFQFRSSRDYFLVMLKNLIKRKSNSSNQHKSTIEDSISHTHISDVESKKKISVRARKSSQNPSLSLKKLKVEKNENTGTKQKTLSRCPSSIQHQKYVNPADVQTDILKQLQSSQLFQDIIQKKQLAILNLRDSFNQLQQKYKKQKIIEKSIKVQNSCELKMELQKARNQIAKLKQQVITLSEQNNNLKIQLSQFNSLQKQIKSLKDKINALNMETQRLEGERTKIITEKIQIDMKFQKEKQQKQSLKQKLQSMNHNNHTINTTNMQKTESNKKIEMKQQVHHFKSPSHFPFVSHQHNDYFEPNNTETKHKKKEFSPEIQKKVIAPMRRIESHNFPFNKY